MSTKTEKGKSFFTYKNRPLVRCGDTLYYGNMADPYVIKMEIKSCLLYTSCGKAYRYTLRDKPPLFQLHILF